MASLGSASFLPALGTPPTRRRTHLSLAVTIQQGSLDTAVSPGSTHSGGAGYRCHRHRGEGMPCPGCCWEMLAFRGARLSTPLIPMPGTVQLRPLTSRLKHFLSTQRLRRAARPGSYSREGVDTDHLFLLEILVRTPGVTSLSWSLSPSGWSLHAGLPRGEAMVSFETWHP